jgi:hypothetical protein
VFCADPTECPFSPGIRLMRMDRAFFVIALAETTLNIGRFQLGYRLRQPRISAGRIAAIQAGLTPGNGVLKISVEIFFQLY